MIALCEKKLGMELEQLVGNWFPETNTYFSGVIHHEIVNRFHGV